MVSICYTLWVLGDVFQPHIPPPPQDTTGVSAALKTFASYGGSLLVAFLSIYIVVCGFGYAMTEESRRGAALKNMIAGGLIAALLILYGPSLAEYLVTLLASGK